ncbi:hypothetical protein [Micromonospora sp. bgisy143]|uniref:hypothetical protein n=1 Tax=Micromonospora sp. bgisy143 TaxID=3413790 RepID=UPI003EB9364C
MPRDIALFVLGVVLTAVVTEFTEVSPWLASRIVLKAAKAWTNDLELQAVYAEEWLAIIEERPGKLFKLFTALSFYGSAITSRAARGVGRFVAMRGVPAGRWLWRWTLALWPPVAWAVAFVLTSSVVAALFEVDFAAGVAVTFGLFAVGGLVMIVARRWWRSRRSQHRRQVDR